MRLGALERDLRATSGFSSNNRYATSPSTSNLPSSLLSNNNNNQTSSSPGSTSLSNNNNNNSLLNNNGDNNNNSNNGSLNLNNNNGPSTSPIASTNFSYYGVSSGNSRLNRDAAFIREAYNFVEEIGTGAFGRVYKGFKKKTSSHHGGSGSFLPGSPGSASLYQQNSSSSMNSAGSGGGISSAASAASATAGQEVFAIKHVDKKKAGASGLKSVLSEVETLALLNHSYIVRLEEVFQDKDNLYIVMELVPGGELASALKQLQRLHESVIRKIILCLLLALEYIHDQGIVHRDLKPANCLLSADGTTVKIADFGFAVMVGPTSCLTENCGTPAYQAPEIVCGNNYGRNVDCWSLGVMMYLMLTGEYPFMENQNESLAEVICKGRYSTSGKVWNSEISAGAKDFLSKLLVTDPTKRWSAGQCLNHSWIRVARPSGGMGSYLAVDGLYAGDDGYDEDSPGGSGGGNSLANQRALSGIQRFQNAIAGNMNGGVGVALGGVNSSGANAAPTARPKRGKMRLKIIFRGAVSAVRASFRLLFFIRLQALRREGLDSIPILRSYSFIVTRRYSPPIPSQMMCKAVAPGNMKVLMMVVAMFESCRTVEVFDFSNNKIDSLDLIQQVVRAVNAHPNLQILNLDNNPIPPLAGRGLLRLARFHPSLKTLSINGTNIGGEVISQIQSALKENEKKRPALTASSTLTPNNNSNAAAAASSNSPSLSSLDYASTVASSSAARHNNNSSQSINGQQRKTPPLAPFQHPPPGSSSSSRNGAHHHNGPRASPGNNSPNPPGNFGSGSGGGVSSYSEYKARLGSASSTTSSSTMNNTSLLSTGSRNSVGSYGGSNHHHHHHNHNNNTQQQHTNNNNNTPPSHLPPRGGVSVSNNNNNGAQHHHHSSPSSRSMMMNASTSSSPNHANLSSKSSPGNGVLSYNNNHGGNRTSSARGGNNNNNSTSNSNTDRSVHLPPLGSSRASPAGGNLGYGGGNSSSTNTHSARNHPASRGSTTTTTTTTPGAEKKEQPSYMQPLHSSRSRRS